MGVIAGLEPVIPTRRACRPGQPLAGMIRRPRLPANTGSRPAPSISLSRYRLPLDTSSRRRERRILARRISALASPVELA